jgi:hypothetical protein
MENLTISGTANATDGILSMAAHRSILRNIRVKNFPTSIMRVKSAVCNYYEQLVGSGADSVMTVFTMDGIILDRRGALEHASDCILDNPIIEGMYGYGLRLVYSDKVMTRGGTSEGNGGGIYVGPNSQENTIDGLDMEINAALTSSFSASTSGSTLTLTSTPSPANSFFLGMLLSGAGITQGTTVDTLLSGTLVAPTR